VIVSASFPAAEIFGIKLVNGKPTEAVLSFTNNEPEPVVVAFVGGSLWTPDFDPEGSRIVRNLTTVQYGVQIASGEKETVPFNFVTDMHPQELRLNLVAVVGDQENMFYTFQAFNGTVNIVEPNTSIFDPQMSVYTQRLSEQRLTHQQNLPLPLPARSFRYRYILLLQHLDCSILRPETPRWRSNQEDS